ncbi:MAG TPA: CheR family methyltransferase [Herbaspirillum sp.]|jgi:two-component system CheB/CheR fusion protein
MTQQPEANPELNSASGAPDFHVVGIGASAGGLPALLRFFESMPAQNDMAFVIVLHLSPEHESNIAKLLQNVTKMPVRQVTEPVRIEKNTTYVIPPSKNLLMEDGHLVVEPMVRPRGKHIAIDMFLRTLAEVHRERAVGIILSGTGSDGAVGIARIREAGGVTIAQDPDDAEYDSMPRSAIDAGVIDMVLPVGDMPQRLIEVVRNCAAIVLPDADLEGLAIPPETGAGARIRSEAALKAIMDILHVRTGHDFTHYKKATVLRRIERRMQVNCVSTLSEYLAYLEREQDETPLLLQDMLISVTNFFRDRDGFEALEREIVPTLFDGAAAGVQIRAWTAGCATGEEAYSVAMLLAEQARRYQPAVDIQVFATDIDKRAIGVGRRGIYPESIAADVSADKLQQFFNKDGNQYQIKKDIREKVLFAAHNILRDPPFSRVHLITCRNLLIYLSRDVQQKIFEMFHFALLPGGYLFLGSSESAEVASKYFIPVDKKNRIYRASGTAHGPHYVPTMAFRHNGPVAPIALAPQEPKPRLPYADLHQRLLEHYAPPSVLVNHEGEIVYLSEKAGHYLRYVGGEPSHNLVTLITPELRLELRTALFQIAQQGTDIETRPVTVSRNGFELNVSLTIRQVQRDQASGQLILVLFNESEKSNMEAPTPEAQSSFMIKQLEGELFVTKEQLQATIEQYETSSEELKASNEELQAINEELRSTTEELETSKEELQSINEELITVNHELKLKADETGKSNDDLQNFIASTEIATIFIDRAMRIKRFTPRATDVFNVIASDVGRPLLDITHKLNYDTLESDASEVFASLRASEREVESDNGKTYIARLIPYRTIEDKIDGLVLTFVDITGLKLAQNKLVEEEGRMRLIAASTKDYAIITQDLDGIITSWNSGAQRIFGYTEAEAIGQPVDILFTPGDRDRGVPYSEMQSARMHGSAIDERWHVRRDGSHFFASGVTTLLDDGEMHGYARIARDLTGIKEAESQREMTLARETATRIQAENASRMREEFLAVLSHELKQPLNLIHLNAEWLKRMPDSRDSAPILRVADTIRSAAISQARIINDLLDLSRFSTGKLALNKSPLDLVLLVERLIEAFADEAFGKGISLVYSAEAAEIPLMADITRIEQIVWNLLSNAIKFTDRGGRVALSLSVQDGMARVHVADTGKGIHADYLPHVFEMFNQADGSTTREHGGLGIGLALVKQLTDSHDGRVEAFSNGPGQGAEFTIWLPLAGGARGDAPLLPNGAADSGSQLRGRRILLVDDDPDCLETFGNLLISHGAHLQRAQGAAQALSLLQDQAYDMIVSDIGMPSMDGYQLLTEVRKLANGHKVPMVAVTGFGRMVDVERALTAGFAAHLQKPVDFEAFMKTLQIVFAG